MFISGQQIAEHFRSEEGGTPGWVEAYLRSRFVECCGPNDVVGEPGDIVGDGLAFGLSGGDGADDSESPDVIKPLPGAKAVFNYGTTTTSTFDVAAVRYRRGQSRVVYFGFNFESISASSTRNELMRRVMGWVNPTFNGLPSTIDGSAGRDTIVGTSHDDVIVAYGGYNRVWGLGGNDTICGGPHIDVVFGGNGNDWINGFGGRDMISAGSGRDEVYGGGSGDLVLGGPGDDALYGQGGNDEVWAGPGADFVNGDAGDDTLLGNDGDDIIDGGPGADAIDCGSGVDIGFGGVDADPDTAAGCELYSAAALAQGLGLLAGKYPSGKAKYSVPVTTPKTFTEAPMLAALVKAGKLPPVEQRLPTEPLVIPPSDSIGQYGGTWRRAYLWAGDHAMLYTDRLAWWDGDGFTQMPRVAKDIQWSTDGRAVTVTLRKGHKWSDGAPFTSADWKWNWD